MSERNDSICHRYMQGATIYQIGKEFSLSHERIRQILRKANIYKNFRGTSQHVGLSGGVVVSDIRDEFLGVNLCEADKTALRQDAKRRGISMSALTADIIKDMLASLPVTE